MVQVIKRLKNAPLCEMSDKARFRCAPQLYNRLMGYFFISESTELVRELGDQLWVEHLLGRRR